MLTYEDKFLMETCGNVKYLLPENFKNNFLTNLDNFLRKLQATGLTKRTSAAVLCCF